MKPAILLYCLAAVLVLSSCTQWRNLRSRDNSTPTAKTSSKKSKAKDVRFLDITVAPGQVVTTKHKTMGPPMPPPEKRQQERDSYNARVRPVANAGDIERADWLQLKYAILLDATVETLTNVNLLKLVDEWYGTSYCSGGRSKNCVDCSGFTRAIMNSVYNINLPGSAQEQYNASQHINLEDLNEGDLVFFHTGGREISHVGIYLLNNKFVHASSSGGVIVNDLNDNYWRSRFKGAGRFINTTAAVKEPLPSQHN